jgi:hypothetical protein
VCWLLPFAIDTFVSYELASYLGDALNLGLLFNSCRRNVNELVAVSSQHIITALWAGAGLAVVVALGVVLVRRQRRASDWSGLPPFWRAMRAPLALLLAATVLSSAVRASSDALDNGLRRKPAGSGSVFS